MDGSDVYHKEFINNSNNLILQSNSFKDIPKDAIILTKQEAAKLRLGQMEHYKPKSEMWAVNYGPWILGICAVIPGVNICQYFRRKLKLRSQGYFSMYTALAYAPLFMTTALHYELVTLPLAALEEKCPICFEAKAGILQSVMSTVYPTLLAGFSGLMFASRHGTVDMPFYKDVKGMSTHYWTLTKPLMRRLSVFVIVETIAANFITYMEAKQMYTYHENQIKNQLRKLDEL